MHEWDTFAVIIGGSAGALVGLLFVALSIHAGRVAESADLRNRAAQTLAIFAVVLLIGVLLAIPLQPEWLLGAELLALGILAAALLITWITGRDRVIHVNRSPRRSRWSTRRR